MQKLTRYSPGGYGAMTEDSEGDYVRLSEIEPRIKKAVDQAVEGGIFAGSLIAEENAEELAKLRDLLRWRKVGEEMPLNRGEIAVVFSRDGMRWTEVIEWFLEYTSMGTYSTHWRPIGPLPEVQP